MARKTSPASAATPPPTPAEFTPNQPEFTVSELSGAIKRALEDGFGWVRLRGEVSGFRGVHSSGHCYLALKDEKSKIDAVIWRGVWGRLKVKPEEGMEVVVQGRITTFPGSSKYQIVIESLEPAGVGALMAILEERKRRLAAEGLFDEARKRKLPFWPRVVGIVTSPTGAVIRDMLHGFAERCPTHVLVWPVRVQGESCPAEVAAAVRGFNALDAGAPVPRPDVLIVARGGGSLEDLWGFNDEEVARAVAASAIPVISAVGHETDWTLIDLVADARAPTPTKAAEWAVPKHAELVEATAAHGLRLRVAVTRSLDGARVHLKAAARGLPRLEDLLALPRQRFDDVDRRLSRALLANTRAQATRLAAVSGRLTPRLCAIAIERAEGRLGLAARAARESMSRQALRRRARLDQVAGRLRPGLVGDRLERAGERLEGFAARSAKAYTNVVGGARRRLQGSNDLLRTLSHHSVLSRGFAVVRDAAGRTLRDAAMVGVGDRLDIELASGRLAATASAASAAPAGSTDDPPEPSRPRTRPAAARKAQASTLTAEPRRPSRTDDGSGGSGQGSLF